MCWGFSNRNIPRQSHQKETFSELQALCEGNPPIPLQQPSDVFPLIYAWTNSWANSRDAGDLRRHRAHSNVTVMQSANAISVLIYTSVPREAVYKRHHCQKSSRPFCFDCTAALSRDIDFYGRWISMHNRLFIRSSTMEGSFCIETC